MDLRVRPEGRSCSRASSRHFLGGLRKNRPLTSSKSKGRHKDKMNGVKSTGGLMSQAIPPGNERYAAPRLGACAMKLAT